MARNRNMTGLITLVGLGAFYAYRNRFKIQQYLESLGVSTKLDTSDVNSTLSSGIAKVTGKVQNAMDQTQHGIKDMDRNSRKIS